MAILADNLLTGVKRRCVLPSNQISLQDTDILAMADEIVKSCIVPLFESANQEYFVYLDDTTEVTASQSLYSIPYRALGRSLRELKLRDDSGNVRNVSLIAIEDAHNYDASTDTLGFYCIGDQIRLVPDVPSTVSDLDILIWYRLPPNSLCASTSAALVVTVASTTVVVSSVPSNLSIGSSVDFIQGKSGNSIYAMDKTITNISGTTLTFASGVIPATAPNALAAGDYISLAQTSPVLNFIPNEASSYLESLTAERVLQSIGDFDGAAILGPVIAREKENLLKIIDPRIDGEPTIIINRSGLVRGNKFAQRRWLYGS